LHRSDSKKLVAGWKVWSIYYYGHLYRQQIWGGTVSFFSARQQSLSCLFDFTNIPVTHAQTLRVRYVVNKFDLTKPQDRVKFIQELNNFGKIIKENHIVIGQNMKGKLWDLNKISRELPSLFSSATEFASNKRKRWMKVRGTKVIGVEIGMEAG
jgi:hypothetical protein